MVLKVLQTSEYAICLHLQKLALVLFIIYLLLAIPDHSFSKKILLHTTTITYKGTEFLLFKTKFYFTVGNCDGALQLQYCEELFCF